VEPIKRQEAPSWARTLDAFNTYLSQDLLGGPKLIKMAWVINLHKFLTVFVVALLMIRFDNYSTAAWVYMALHGAYGFCWLLKHVAFRDPKWDTKVTIAGGTALFFLLTSYWVAPYVLISRASGPNRATPSNWLIALCIALFTLGLTIMVASDCQKQFTLKYRRGLITEGMFKHVRHPNYLGEMMLYASYALLAQHWTPWVVLAYWWTALFFVNMLMIQSSISRYPGWEAYKARTGMLLPWRCFMSKPTRRPAEPSQVG
jgi:protein-S-isoprenylcysteine O-methyltransferase Ste14